MTRDFLEGHADFKLEHQRQLLPFTDGVDGAYVARLRKYGAESVLGERLQLV